MARPRSKPKPKKKRKLSAQERERRRQQRIRDQAARSDGGDYSVEAWCHRRGIGKTTFYEMMKNGTAPETMKVRKRRIISASADQRWQAKQEQQAAA